MDLREITNMYNFSKKTVVITGGAGVLGSEIACALVGCGANVAIIDRDTTLAEEVVKKIDTSVGNYIIVYGDVLDREKMDEAAQHIIKTFGDVYCLINAAGGNHPKATTSPDFSFFDLDPKSIEKVTNLNLLGTIIPCQVFGKYFSEKKRRNYPEYIIDECLPAVDKDSGLFSGKGCRIKFYPMAGRSYGPGIFTEYPRKCNRSGIFPHCPE